MPNGIKICDRMYIKIKYYANWIDKNGQMLDLR